MEEQQVMHPPSSVAKNIDAPLYTPPTVATASSATLTPEKKSEKKDKDKKKEKKGKKEKGETKQKNGAHKEESYKKTGKQKVEKNKETGCQKEELRKNKGVNQKKNRKTSNSSSSRSSSDNSSSDSDEDIRDHNKAKTAETWLWWGVLGGLLFVIGGALKMVQASKIKLVDGKVPENRSNITESGALIVLEEHGERKNGHSDIPIEPC